MVEYDKHYRDGNYFGNPYMELMAFFEKSKKGTLVDLGAGQGRDSIPLSQMGYYVTAVDISRVGINQIIEQQPNIKAFVSDLYTFDISGFDYVLMNSILHFYKADLEKEIALVKRILGEMKSGAVFVNCLLKSRKAEEILKASTSSFQVTILEDRYIMYPEFEAQYHLFVVIKND